MRALNKFSWEFVRHVASLAPLQTSCITIRIVVRHTHDSHAPLV